MVYKTQLHIICGHVQSYINTDTLDGYLIQDSRFWGHKEVCNKWPRKDATS